jgi:hypothetical protein
MTDALDLWHEHRIPIILSTLFVLSLVRIYLHSTQQREELRVLPKAYEKLPQNGSAGAVEKPKVVVKDDDSEGSESPKTGSEKRGTKQGPKRIKGDVSKKGRGGTDAGSDERKIQVLVFYSSLTTTTEKVTQTFTEELAASLGCTTEKKTDSKFLPPRVLDLAEIDLDEYFIAPPKPETEQTDLFYLFIIPSYNIDSINVPACADPRVLGVWLGRQGGMANRGGGVLHSGQGGRQVDGQAERAKARVPPRYGRLEEGRQGEIVGMEDWLDRGPQAVGANRGVGRGCARLRRPSRE